MPPRTCTCTLRRWNYGSHVNLLLLLRIVTTAVRVQCGTGSTAVVDLASTASTAVPVTAVHVGLTNVRQLYRYTGITRLLAIPVPASLAKSLGNLLEISSLSLGHSKRNSQ